MSRIRGRMLHGSISNSARVNGLSCDGARLLFTWLIPHCDNLGRIRAEPLQLKAEILPRHPSTIAQVKRWTIELHEAGLVVLYKCQDQLFIEVAGWKRYQRLDGNMSRHSVLPPPPQATDEERLDAVHTPYEHVRTKIDGVVHEGEGEGEGETNQTLFGASPNDTDSEASHPDPDGRVSVARWFEEVFWPAYPKKASKAEARAVALRMFRGLSPADEDALGDLVMDGLERYARSMHDKDPKFILHANRWLKAKRWEDDIA